VRIFCLQAGPRAFGPVSVILLAELVKVHKAHCPQWRHQAGLSVVIEPLFWFGGVFRQLMWPLGLGVGFPSWGLLTKPMQPTAKVAQY
jgi:hypothetical protein